MTLEISEIIEKKNTYLIPCSYHFYKAPPQLVRGEMQYLYDEKGKRYLDFFAGVSVMSCGHCNPEILDKTISQLRTLQHTTSIYLTGPIVELAEKLAKILPGDISRSFFCNSGSEANEGAMLLARLHTGREGIIGLKNGLHGRTHLTMGVTGVSMWRTSPNPCENTYIVENFYPDEEKCLKEIETLILEKDIAAVIAEPIQGNGGIVVPPFGFFKSLRKLLGAHGVLLILDEVQTGFGRTGKTFAIEHFGIIPDIITTAKALGNGVPISCFSSTNEIAKSFTRPSASTFGGNPVASVNALAVLQYMEEHSLTANAERLGNLLHEKLVALKEKYPLITDVRGLGLMQGVELTTPELADEVLEKMKDCGILVGKNGPNRNVVAMQPPLVINESDIDFVAEKLDECLSGEGGN